MMCSTLRSQDSFKKYLEDSKVKNIEPITTMLKMFGSKPFNSKPFNSAQGDNGAVFILEINSSLNFLFLFQTF